MDTRIELLRILNLPIFEDEDELASLMHISPSIIKIIVLHPERFYKKYRIRKSTLSPHPSGRDEINKRENLSAMGLDHQVMQPIIKSFSM